MKILTSSSRHFDAVSRMSRLTSSLGLGKPFHFFKVNQLHRLNLFVSSLVLISCAAIGADSGSTPVPIDQVSRLKGQEVYGQVLRVTEGVEDDVSRSADACRKRDALCIALLEQARSLQYATVHLYGSIVFMKTFVPRGQVEAGDIIKLKISQHSGSPPMFVEMGAKAADRKAEYCDWVDGTAQSLQGGVSCRGWTYKSIAGSL